MNQDTHERISKVKDELVSVKMAIRREAAELWARARSGSSLTDAEMKTVERATRRQSLLHEVYDLLSQVQR